MCYRLLLSVACLLLSVEHTFAEPPRVDFSRDIRPLLSDRCFQCHGPDAAARQSGLRLDQREAATAELESGAKAIVPGRPDESEMLARIDSEDDAMRMPPMDSGKTLSSIEREMLRKWIEAGAPFERHWAFTAPRRSEVPRVKARPFVQNPIDAFVLARLEAQGLEPSQAADPQDLVRRLYLDLIGLPPSTEEIDKFLGDPRPDAYERLVDELMQSPHYGERMAIEWLDGARFADSNGYQNDFRRTMWPWRDWVINAYNNHMPYDQFVIEQLAGDLLPEATLAQRIATGFNRNNRTVTESGSLEEEWRVENVMDRVEATGNVFLGLTIGCARCHDHKFDPISQREFYEFYSFFNNVNELGVYLETPGNVAPLVQVPDPEQVQKLALLKQRHRAAEDRLAKVSHVDPETRTEWLAHVQRDTPAAEPVPQFIVPLAGDRKATGKRSDVQIEPTNDDGEVLPAQSEEFFGPAASFQGAQRLTYPNAVRFERDHPYSIAAWVKTSSLGAVVSQMSTLENFRGSDILVLDDLRVAVHLIHEWPTNAIKVITADRLPVNEWSYVVVTYDGSSKASGIQVLLNGKQQKLTTEVDHLTGRIGTDQPFRVGSRSADAKMTGAVRDVRVFSHALDLQETLSLTRGALSTLR